MKYLKLLLQDINDFVEAIEKTDDVPGVSRELDTSACDLCSCGLTQQLEAAADALRQIRCLTENNLIIGADETKRINTLSSDAWREAIKKPNSIKEI